MFSRIGNYLKYR